MALSDEREKAERIARSVAAHLKDWTVEAEEGHWGVYLVHPCGARIFVTTARHAARGRVVFSGCAPKHKNGQSDGWGWTWDPKRKTTVSNRLEVTCAATRDPKAIASEVERRLIPRFLDAWRAAAAKVDTEDTALEDMITTAKRIATVLDVGFTSESARRPKRGDGIYLYPTLVERFVVHAARDTVDGYHPTSVEMRLSDVRPETAVAIIRMLEADKASRATSSARVAKDKFEMGETDADDVGDDGKRRGRAGGGAVRA